MINRKNNAVVGLFVLLSVFILLFGIYFLKEATPGRKTDSYQLLFSQVSTLQDGDPVKVNGVKAGQVQSISLKDHEVLVKVSLARGIRLPKDSDVRIQNIGLMGERQIGILLGPSKEYLEPGATLRG